jgi:hypothetical protein
LLIFSPSVQERAWNLLNFGLWFYECLTHGVIKTTCDISGNFYMLLQSFLQEQPQHRKSNMSAMSMGYDVNSQQHYIFQPICLVLKTMRKGKTLEWEKTILNTSSVPLPAVYHLTVKSRAVCI